MTAAEAVAVDLTPRPARGPFTLEKWYIDTLMEDGTVLLVYLGRVRLLGAWFVRVTADLFEPDGTRVAGSSAGGRVSGREGGLVFGSAAIDCVRLEFETPGLSGKLTFRPRFPPVTLGRPFLSMGKRELTWDVEAPDADVQGEVWWPDGRRQIAGRGYRDRVWFDLVPWRFPIKRLVWGRAAAGEHAATWVRATTTEGELNAGWTDGRADSDAIEAVALEDSRVLLRSAVADLEGLRLGPLKPALRRLTLDPHEVKWAAHARIGGAQGVAIHEVVTWR